MKLGFVYKWVNAKNGMVYIGRHQGSPDDGYIASSQDFLMSYESHKKDWHREILFAGDYEKVKKQESIEIKKAVKDLGKDLLFNKCSSTRPGKLISEMSQGDLYKLYKHNQMQIQDLKKQITELELQQFEITKEKKKFSTKKMS